MQILGMVNIDSQWRIYTGNILSANVEFVEFSVESDTGIIFITPVEKSEFCVGNIRRRVQIPTWVRQILPEGTRKLLVVSHEGMRGLVPMTGPIEWKKIPLDVLLTL